MRWRNTCPAPVVATMHAETSVLIVTCHLTATFRQRDSGRQPHQSPLPPAPDDEARVWRLTAVDNLFSRNRYPIVAGDHKSIHSSLPGDDKIN